MITIINRHHTESWTKKESFKDYFSTFRILMLLVLVLDLIMFTVWYHVYRISSFCSPTLSVMTISDDNHMKTTFKSLHNIREFTLHVFSISNVRSHGQNGASHIAA